MTVDGNIAREALERFFLFEPVPADDPMYPAALAAVARLEAENERLGNELAKLHEERKLGPQPNLCTNPECSLISYGTGYAACPRCGDDGGLGAALGLEGSEPDGRAESGRRPRVRVRRSGGGTE